MSLINFVALGGVQETGKNLYVLEVDNDIFILDCGMKYPPSEVFGVDCVLPDISYLISNASKLRGIFLTHAHDDHIAALPTILKYIKLPIYGSNFTLEVVKDLMKENGLNIDDYKFFVADDRSVFKFRSANVEFVGVNHSVPESKAIVVKTEDGAIIYTGNFNFNQNSEKSYLTNINKLCDISEQGVLCLLPESIGVNYDINRGTITTFQARLNKLFTNAPGRIIISLFSTNLQRIQSIIDMAVSFNKRVAIIGRKTQRIVNIAINQGYLNVDKNNIVNLRYIDDKNQNNDKDLVVLVTGERHEPYYMLQRMCRKVDRLIRIEANDTVCVLTRPAIGTEKMAARTLDMLYKETDKVIEFPSSLILSASSGPEEAKQMINLTKPKYILPVVGEYRHQYSMINLCKGLGYDERDLAVVEAGKVYTFDNKKFKGVTGVVQAGDILLDGKGLGNVSSAVIRDREMLAEAGVLMIVANINAKRREVVAGPEFVAKGFYIDESDIALLKETFEKVKDREFTSRFVNWVEFKNELKTEITKAVYKKTKNNPVVIPVIISTEPK